MTQIDLREILEKHHDLFDNSNGRAIDPDKVIAAMREACEQALDMAAEEIMKVYNPYNCGSADKEVLEAAAELFLALKSRII